MARSCGICTKIMPRSYINPARSWKDLARSFQVLAGSYLRSCRILQDLVMIMARSSHDHGRSCHDHDKILQDVWARNMALLVTLKSKAQRQRVRLLYSQDLR